MKTQNPKFLWRFERKCFRANIETSAAKTRRSRIFFLLISVGEEFVVFHLCISIPKIVRLLRLRHLFIDEMIQFFLKR